MRVDLGAEIRTSDGAEAGKVKRAIYDPAREQVTAFVVDTGGLLGKSVVVPVERFSEATPDGAVRIALNEREFGELEAYRPDAYGAPPVAWVPPVAMYPYPGIGYLWPMTALSTVPSPDAGRRRTLPALSKGMLVQDRDGDDVGVLENLQTNADGDPIRIVVRLGGTLRTTFGGGTEVVLDPDSVVVVTDDVVHLRLHETQLRALLDQPSAGAGQLS